MKKAFNSPGTEYFTLPKATSKIIFCLLLALVMASGVLSLIAQPVTKKVLTFNSGNTPSCDWIYSIIASEDCVHYYFAGYSEAKDQNGTVIRRYPVMGKINSITSKLIWERNYSVSGFTGNGTFNSIIEDGDVIIAAGEQAESGSTNRKMIINKVLSSNGDPILYSGSTYYPVAIFSNSFNSRLNEIKPIRDGSGNLTGFIGIGSKDPLGGNNEKALFAKLDAQGNPDQNFGNGGYFELNDSRHSRGLNGILVEGHNTIKYALVGRILETTNSSVHNALIVTIDAAGDLIWKEELGESGNENGVTQDFGYVDINSGNEYNSCLGQNYEGMDQLARDIIQDGVYFIISAEYDWFGTNFSSGTCGQNLDGDDTYRMIDGVLIKMEIDNGDVYFGENVGLFEGDAFYCDLEIKDGSYYVLGSTAQVINGRLSSKTQVVRTDNEGAILYTKTVNKPSNATWETDCGFDMAFDCNDELIIGGDANVNEEDYFVQVLSNDCLSSFTYTVSDNVTINSMTVWNSSRSVKRTVIIESGGTLVINSGAVVQFGASWETVDLDLLSTNSSTLKTGRIVVKSGGNLRLDNCTVKGVYACGKDWMWDGIELHDGGQVFQANGAIIQDAKIGILVGSGIFGNSGTFNPTEADGGGTISATSGTISNCRRCIHFAPCTSNASTVSGIDFVCSGFLKDPSYRHFVNFPPNADLVLTGMGTKEFVTANTAAGMVFDGCAWSNSASVPKGWKGIGINSYNSSYQYTGGNEITGLQTGIFATSAADPTKFIYVSGGNDFSDNSIAIRFTGGSNHIITNENTFNMTINASHPGLGSKPDGIGIYNGGATRIKIENNDFNGASSSYGPQAYGVINENTGPDATHHKKNNFNTLLYGEQTQRNNGGMNLWCNEHDDNLRAWNINPSTFGVFPDQGFCNSSPGFIPENSFYDACPQSQINHIRTTLAFDYWYKNSEQDYPQCNSNNVDVQQCSESVINTGCDESIYLNPANADDYLSELPEMPASHHRQELVNDLIRHYIMEQDMTTVKEILASESGISYRFDLAFILLNEGEFADAQDTISTLNSSDPEVIDMVRFFNVVKATLMDDRSLAELLTAEIDTLQLLSENRTLGAYQAQAILTGLYGYNFPALVETDSSLVERSQKKNNGILVKETVLKIQPNPVSDYLMIEIPTFNDFRERSLLLTSIDGKILLKIALKIGQTQMSLDLSSLPQGLYSLHLVDSSKIYPPQKLVKY